MVACVAASGRPCGATPVDPPPIDREFRGAWIATVANIDWPSKPGLSSRQQKEELTRLFDVATELNLNAIILQVRPACDAFYRSKHEPWSQWLTGAIGKRPRPAYDPLEFAVEQAHQRGLQLHAWFNPYRASHPTGSGKLSAKHVSKKMPEAVVEYGKYLWLDPGHPTAEQHTLDVILDVVRSYDVDGVHFDDYFYPYPVTETVDGGAGSDDNGLSDTGERRTRVKPFPDDRSWALYLEQTSPSDRLSRDDWRRENVNRLVRRVAEEVKRAKPEVAFGISPFGIWRPGHPSSVVGFDPYEKLYADSKLWLQEGWVDYAAPQLYWPIRSQGQSYPLLLDWWRRQNTRNRLLLVGNFTSRIGPKPNGSSVWSAAEVVDQVRLTQSFKGVGGNVHFSMKALAENRDGIADRLRAGPYAKPALPPAYDLLAAQGNPPKKPEATLSRSTLRIRPAEGQSTQLLAIQVYAGGSWIDFIVPGQTEKFDLSAALADGAEWERVAVRAIDRLGRESPAALFDTKRLSRRPSIR
ncbi:MAG: family 10 glycosylhydrolase [Planctomycetota bacterium]